MRPASPLIALAVLLLGAGVALGGGSGTTTVEGGTYFDYLAPDPGGPTDGGIRFGFSGVAEVIAADAVLVPPADTNLAFLGNGTPTCLAVTREGGAITRIEFVAECNVSGTVMRVDDVFGPGGDAYIIGDRLAAPADFVEGIPEFAALIGVPAASGGNLDVVFQIDLATGAPSSFIGQTSVTGPVSDLGGGDIGIGDATLRTAVIDDASRALLEEAAALGVDATAVIVGLGTFQEQGDPILQIELTVTYSAPTPVASPVPTAAPSAAALPDTGSAPAQAGPSWLSVGAFALLVAGWLASALTHRRRQSRV
ncbi:MAG TPA: hypothetical protein VIH24_05935 [Candidatus Limnocylindria bacterium]|jgi:hypothetical protein